MSYFQSIKTAHGSLHGTMTRPFKCVCKKELLLLSKSFAVSGKTTPSVAESCERQNGGKQYFVGKTAAELKVVFQLDVAENTEKQ